jgi:hypothetical protein
MLIGVGLAILFASVCVPIVPVVTAMAMVSLGATKVTLSRFHGSAAMLPVLALHAMTYGGLYALFIGAVLDAAASSPEGVCSAPVALDLAASTLPAAACLRRIGNVLRSQLMVH